MILAATTSKIELLLGGAVTTNQLPFIAAWMDVTATTSTPGHSDGQSNGASVVTLVDVPAASTQRVITHINIYNADTVSAVVTVRYNANGTIRVLQTLTLAPGDSLAWSPEESWEVIDNAGRVKQTNLASFAYSKTTYLTAASGTYTVPAGVRALFVRCYGAGGGGGGASYSVASNAAVGGGGAAGGYAEKWIQGPAASYAYTNGAGGTAGASSGGTGGTGGDAVFGTNLCTAKGGLGGVGQTYGTAAAFVLGGDGQTATYYGDLVDYGCPGGYAHRESGTVACSGAGGSSLVGKGGNSRITNGAGNAGSNYGAGGGGACALSSAQAGGVGSAALIVVEEYY